MQSGGTPSVAEPKFWARPGEGTPWVSIGDMSDGSVVLRTEHELTKDGLQDRGLTVSPAGTLLFAMYASVGAVATLGMPAVWNQALLGLRPRRGLSDLRFTRYWLEHLRPQLAGLVRSNTQDNLNADQVGNLPFPVLSVARQQAIADFLDSATPRIDTLINKKQRVIEVLAEQRDRELDHIALPGFSPSSRRSPADVPLSVELGRTWHVSPIGHCLIRITYGFTNPMPTSDEDGPYMLTANDIGEGFIRFDSARRTTQQAFTERLTEKSRPRPGDILLTKDGTLGRVAHFEGGLVCINQSVAVLTPDKRSVEPELLFQLFRVPAYREALVFNAGGTTIKHLYISRVVKQALGLPTRAEHLTLARELSNIHQRHVQRVAALSRSIELLQEHRQALITAAVTSEIDLPGAAA